MGQRKRGQPLPGKGQERRKTIEGQERLKETEGQERPKETEDQGRPKETEGQKRPRGAEGQGCLKTPGNQEPRREIKGQKQRPEEMEGHQTEAVWMMTAV